MTQKGGQDRIPDGASELPAFDTRVPNPARIWNYWVGGKDNFASDREAATKVLEAMPAMPVIARLVRRLLNPGSSMWTMTRWCSATPGRC